MRVMGYETWYMAHQATLLERMEMWKRFNLYVCMDTMMKFFQYL